jgi:hypothetical protein
MAKHHGGTHHVQGVLNRGTAPRPSPQHAGSGRPKGVTHAPQPQIYGTHGGTSLPRVLKRKK